MDKSLSVGARSFGGSINARENNAGFQQKPVRFLADLDINGVYLLEDSSLVKMLQKRLHTFNHGSNSSSIFPATLPVPITTFNQLENGSFVFSPKPLGIRYLFYFDKKGRTFLEDSAENIFKVAKSRAFRVIPPETVLDGIVVRKIVRAEHDSNQEASNGKLTFVIMDATRVNGVDLTQKNILERMSAVQAQIMESRNLGVKKIIRAERDVFDLEMTNYEALSRMEDYLTQDFNDSYPYPRRSFVFYPTVGTYACGNFGKRILEWEDDTNRDMLMAAAKNFK